MDKELVCMFSEICSKDNTVFTENPQKLCSDRTFHLPWTVNSF